MPLHTHKILVICGSEKKRALIFVEKCGRGGEIKNSEKCINLLKSAYCAKNENFSPFFTIQTKMALARKGGGGRGFAQTSGRRNKRFQPVGNRLKKSQK